MSLPFALLLAVQLSSGFPDAEYRQPQLAVSGKTVAVTFGAGNAVYFAASHDGGLSFTRPVKVADAKSLSLGRHRGPRIAITRRGLVISAITGEKGRGADGELTAWRSADGGKTWSSGVVVNDVPAAAREGLHAMAAGPDGALFAAWLDLRQNGMRLFGSVSNDGGATWSANRLLYESPDGHICECCHPSAAFAANGDIVVMFRNWLGGSRDMYTARSSDGGKTFREVRKQGDGTWPLNACPMDGGGLAVRSGIPVTAWRRDGTVYLAEGGREVELGKGKDVALALDAAGRPYVIWSTPSGLKARTPRQNEPIHVADSGAYAVLAGDGPVYAAWETSEGIRIEPLR